jgi:quinol monooxygenase YgiN
MTVEVIAHVKVREGQLEGFKAQAAEIVRVTQEQDTHTTRCDWFLNEDGTECEVHEMFPDEQGLIEHQMHIMGPRTVLFRDFAYDHRSAIYGAVSQDFINMVKARMGAAPTTFSFLQGLEHNAATSSFEVIARLKIRPGQLEGFTSQAAEIMRLTRAHDTQTLRYDWFVKDDGTECEVHEAYVGEGGLVEHNEHVMAARAVLFEKYASDHRMSVYGEISPEMRVLFDRHAGGVATYSFLGGLGSTTGAAASGGGS